MEHGRSGRATRSDTLSGTGSAQRSVAGGMGGGNSVVPPPPSVSAGGSLTGQGMGNRGVGLGGPLDAGLAAAPPTSNGGGSASGVVVSSQPGSKLACLGTAAAEPWRCLQLAATSPAWADRAVVRYRPGRWAGQRLLRPRFGRGQGRHRPGSDPMARGGISPYPGAGGAGTGTNGTPAMPGVSVRGQQQHPDLAQLRRWSKGSGQPGTFEYQS